MSQPVNPLLCMHITVDFLLAGTWQAYAPPSWNIVCGPICQTRRLMLVRAWGPGDPSEAHDFIFQAARTKERVRA